MKLLLDSCVILWWLTEPLRLHKKAHQAIADTENDVFISAASLWELGIKHKLGRLELPHHFLDVLNAEKIRILPIEAQHALAVIDLPMIHQNPFDRMLIAQAKCEDLILVTKDAFIREYPVKTMLC